MRKINLEDYNITKLVINPGDQMGEPIKVVLPYRVKDSLIEMLFTRDLQLGAADLVKQNMLAIKIEACTDGGILLEDAEYDRVKRAIDTIRGFNRFDVELVRRINEAEVVEVEQKQK